MEYSDDGALDWYSNNVRPVPQVVSKKRLKSIDIEPWQVHLVDITPYQ